MLGAVQGVGLAFQLDPALARGGLDAELMFERDKIEKEYLELIKKIEELMNVRGIGEKAFLKMKGQLTVAAPKADQQ